MGKGKAMTHKEQDARLTALIDSFKDTYYLDYILEDKNIFTDEAKNTFINIQDEKERLKFIEELLEQFYRNNSEYSNFITVYAYDDPMALLDFFKAIKKSHFTKCGVPFEIPNYKDRYKSLKKLIKEAEIAIELTPIKLDDITTIWPILRIKNLFKESELAAFYYLQHPKTEDAGTDEYNIPFGQYLFLTAYTISHTAAGRNFRYDLTNTGKKKSDRNKQITVKPIQNGFEIKEEKGGSYNSVTIINKDLIQSTSAMKLFIFLLSKANQQNFNPVIYFSLQELVNIGMYSNITNARAGFKQHITAVQSLQMAGEIKKGRKNIKQEGGVLFYNHKIDQNGVTVWVNENFNIEYLASYYTILPAWAWSLNNSAFEILLYIFMKSRTERKDTFNLSLSIIREKLALPTKEEYIEKGKKFKAGQYVKQPIIETIDNIIEAIRANKDENISIEPHYIVNDNSLDEWLKGCVSVTIKGEYTEKLKEIQSKQTKIIETNTKRKEAARALVEAQKEAEKIKN